MLLGSVAEIRRLRRLSPSLLAESVQGIRRTPCCLGLVPAFNEEVAIVRTVESLLALDYQALEVIVVNDGSDDRTMAVLTERFVLTPVRNEVGHDLMTQRVKGVFASAMDARLRVVDKRNGGKADALNCGIDTARFALVLSVDADVVLSADALVHLAAPLSSTRRPWRQAG